MLQIFSSDSGRVTETLLHTGISCDKNYMDERLRERNWGPYTGFVQCQNIFLMFAVCYFS